MTKSKYYWRIIFLLAILATLLVFLVNWKYQIITSASIVTNKDIIDVISKFVSSLAIVIGGILSYYKFFKGRIFSERLKLYINARVTNVTELQNFHFIDIQLENVGTITVWEPRIFLDIVHYSEDRKEEKVDLIERNTEKNEDELYKPLIEVSESVSNHFNHLVDVKNWLVVYRVKVVSKRGNIWERLVSIPNQKDYTHKDK